MAKSIDVNVLKTGTEFTAIDKLGSKYRYRFVGVDLHDLAEGVGCRYLVLRNLDTDSNTCVEAQWFTEREIVVHGRYIE